MDRPYLFPSSAEPFVMNLYDVAAWLSSLVDDGLRDVLLICRGPE